MHLVHAGEDLKLLHLTFHRGCEREIADIAKVLSIDVETWFIPDLARERWDPLTENRNSLYNMGHERAQRLWEDLAAEFDRFDAILTSDTAPLARIFLQNGYKKPLIIWICNRFDYTDTHSLDCPFPDSEFYALFAAACGQENVQVISYTPFEHHYARSKGIETKGLLITPCAPLLGPGLMALQHSQIPAHVDRKASFFLPPYHNENKFMDLSAHFQKLNIPHYRGRYAGPLDLEGFKGIIHLPYNWSNLALFENLALGIPYFIPSRGFFKQLVSQGNYFHGDLGQLLREDLFDLSEWYAPDRAALFTYFDSWEDLKKKIEEADFGMLRAKTLAYAQTYRTTMLDRWKTVFEWAKAHVSE